MALENRLRLLYLSSWFPYPPDNGSRQRAFHLLKQLAARHEISLFAFYDGDQTPPQCDALRAYCRDLTTLPRRMFNPRGIGALRAFVSPLPRSVTHTFDADLYARIQEHAAREAYDAILVGELGMAPYGRGIRAHVKILDAVEAGVFADAFQNAQGAARLRAGLTWWKFKHYVRNLAAEFDALTVVSPREHALVSALGIPARKIHVVPNGVDCKAADAISAAWEPNTCIYNGALTFAPNYDAVRYFVREILPRVRVHEPNARVRITGRADQVAQNELSADNVVLFTGYVADVKPLVKASAVCIVPLRMGGGTRLKILEAMALRTPVVSTSKGAEGLNVKHREHLLIADTPVEFANAILELFRNPALREQLTRAAYQLVCAEYDWTIIARQLDKILVEDTPQ
jgi:glycosyltransferase involved in cell wall biosynthesis